MQRGRAACELGQAGSGTQLQVLQQHRRRCTARSRTWTPPARAGRRGTARRPAATAPRGWRAGTAAKAGLGGDARRLGRRPSCVQAPQPAKSATHRQLLLQRRYGVPKLLIADEAVDRLRQLSVWHGSVAERVGHVVAWARTRKQLLQAQSDHVTAAPAGRACCRGLRQAYAQDMTCPAAAAAAATRALSIRSRITAHIPHKTTHTASIAAGGQHLQSKTTVGAASTARHLPTCLPRRHPATLLLAAAAINQHQPWFCMHVQLLKQKANGACCITIIRCMHLPLTPCARRGTCTACAPAGPA